MLLSEFYGQIGDIYHQMDAQDSAFVQYERALKYNPQNLGILNNYSYYLSLQKKDLNKAERMSSITIKAEPTNPTYLDTYGWILFEQGAYTMAKIYLENAVKYSEESGSASSEVYEHYGDVLYKSKDIFYPEFNGLNKYTRYILDEKLVVRGNIYIGIEQLTTNFINIGFDRNSDATDNIFYNV